MSVVVAYDLDGVLATGPRPSEKKWGKMNGQERKARQEQVALDYQNATPILNPPEEYFHVISARKAEPAIRAITEQWLLKHFGARVLSLNLLREGRNIENVVAFKAWTLHRLKATRFTEDNRDVLRGIRKALPKVELFYFDGKTVTPYR